MRFRVALVALALLLPTTAHAAFVDWTGWSITSQTGGATAGPEGLLEASVAVLPGGMPGSARVEVAGQFTMEAPGTWRPDLLWMVVWDSYPGTQGSSTATFRLADALGLTRWSRAMATPAGYAIDRRLVEYAYYDPVVLDAGTYTLTAVLAASIAGSPFNVPRGSVGHAAQVVTTFRAGPGNTNPEPASVVLMGMGVAGLLLTLRRRHRAA